MYVRPLNVLSLRVNVMRAQMSMDIWWNWFSLILFYIGRNKLIQEETVHRAYYIYFVFTAFIDMMSMVLYM